MSEFDRWPNPLKPFEKGINKMNHHDRPELTKGQALATCQAVWPLLDAATELTDPSKRLDPVALRTLLEQAARLLAASLGWRYPSRERTFGSVEAAAVALLEAQGAVKALLNFCQGHAANASASLEIDGARKLLTGAMMNVISVLDYGILQDPRTWNERPEDDPNAS